MTLSSAATLISVLDSVRAQFAAHKINIILNQPATKLMQCLEEQLGKSSSLSNRRSGEDALAIYLPS